MSFYGSYSWIGLTLAIRGCNDIVIKIVENRQDELPRKLKYSRSKLEPPIQEQMMLFPTDNKSREKMADMVEAIEYCRLKNQHSGFHFPKSKYAQYEMIGFVREISDAEWEPQIAKMKRIAGGEVPEAEECLNLIAFLDKIERRAMYRHDRESHGGGCF
jgi:hypothetical protein